MVENECIYVYTYTNKVRYCTLTMDSLVWAMSVMTPSEMMSRMKYCEPSVTAEAYLPSRKERGQRSAGLKGRCWFWFRAHWGPLLTEALLPPANIRVSPLPPPYPKIQLHIARPMSQSGR